MNGLKEWENICIVDQPIIIDEQFILTPYVPPGRFKEALSSFEVIKKRIGEIDALLKKTKDIREKEEEDFEAWEHEITEIKDRIAKIDDKLFSRVD